MCGTKRNNVMQHILDLRSLKKTVGRSMLHTEISKINHYRIRFPKIHVPLDMHVIDSPASITVKNI